MIVLRWVQKERLFSEHLSRIDILISHYLNIHIWGHEIFWMTLQIPYLCYRISRRRILFNRNSPSHFCGRGYLQTPPLIASVSSFLLQKPLGLLQVLAFLMRHISHFKVFYNSALFAFNLWFMLHVLLIQTSSCCCRVLWLMFCDVYQTMQIVC